MSDDIDRLERAASDELEHATYAIRVADSVPVSEGAAYYARAQACALVAIGCELGAIRLELASIARATYEGKV